MLGTRGLGPKEVGSGPEWSGPVNGMGIRVVGSRGPEQRFGWMQVRLLSITGFRSDSQNRILNLVAQGLQIL